jgi:hypothetical protein
MLITIMLLKFIRRYLHLQIQNLLRAGLPLQDLAFSS